MQTDMASREKQINFKVTPEEAERFDRVAAHFGIPLAAMVRMLVKEKADALAAADGAELGIEQWDVLSELQQGARNPGELALELNRLGYDARLRWLGRTLNELREDGYIRKAKGSYTLTPKGSAYLQANNRPRT